MLIGGLAPAVEDELVGDLLLLQRDAYACEAVLIGDDRIPPLHEGPEDLVAAPLTWLGASTEGRLASD